MSKRAQIQNLLGQPYAVSGQRLKVSASAGLAFFPDDGMNADELLAQADRDMYAQKHAPSKLNG